MYFQNAHSRAQFLPQSNAQITAMNLSRLSVGETRSSPRTSIRSTGRRHCSQSFDRPPLASAAKTGTHTASVAPPDCQAIQPHPRPADRVVRHFACRRTQRSVNTKTWATVRRNRRRCQRTTVSFPDGNSIGVNGRSRPPESEFSARRGARAMSLRPRAPRGAGRSGRRPADVSAAHRFGPTP
jgi:hypothetical protein